METAPKKETAGEKLIRIAAGEVGIKEMPPDSNNVKYNTWFYNKAVSGAPYPWCGTFVSWVYDQAGMNLGNIGYTKGFAGCGTAVSNIPKWGTKVDKPEAGDVVFFDWNGDKKYDHTGIFRKDLGNGLFECIEGNTSIGNDSNGGSVMVRHRRYSVAIFVRPNSKR